MHSLIVKDETITGEIVNEVKLRFMKDSITVQEIIAERVEREVDEYNRKLPDYFKGLIQPSEAEQTLNGFKMKKRAVVDAEKQVLVALASFKENTFFILIDDYQAESLEEVIQIKDFMKVSFVKLTPLVGG